MYIYAEMRICRKKGHAHSLDTEALLECISLKWGKS